MKTARFLPFVGLCLSLIHIGSDAHCQDVPTASSSIQRPVWNLEALSKAPETFQATGFEKEGVSGIFYSGLPYHGKPTRVFAWVGFPKVAPGTKVPGIVLVHGGGGTAFDSWVRLWTSRGYAAIAMDNCGGLPIRAEPKRWLRHEFSGPSGWGGWNQMNEAGEDQWTYHAVADVILAHSLLRSFPEVDPERTGITGISWGGYLTCIASSVDPRFKFAVPIYGCGFTNEHGFAQQVAGLGTEKAARWMEWWDPSSYLAQSKVPTLWVTGSNDFAYTLNALQKSYHLAQGPQTLCVRLRMPHGHGGAGENPKEIQVFADSIVSDGKPLAKVTAQGREKQSAWVKFESQVPVVAAELNFTKDTGRWQDRKWESLPAELTNGVAKAELPEGTTVYYFNLTDDRNCVVSSEHGEVTVP